MPRAPLLLLPLLLFACRSSDDPYGGPPPERLLDVQAQGEGLVPYGNGFAVKMADSWRSNQSIPDGIRRRLESGATWIVLREPVVFAGAARWLAGGDTPFTPTEIELKSAHDRRDDDLGRDLPLRPALLVLRGPLPTDTVPESFRIERLSGLSIEKLGLGHGIKSVRSEVDRVALGRGIETAMRLATGQFGDTVGQSSYDWIATFKDGAMVDDAEWIAAIDKSAEERRPYRAVVRRYRPSAEPRESWYGVPLNVVLLCSQMNLERGTDGRMQWTWEGFWLGRLDKPSPPPAAGKPPAVRVVYAEFRSAKGQRRGGDYLSSVFDPVTRTGKTALEELRKRGSAAFLPTTE